MKTTFSQNASNNYKIACALTEDNVTGTSSGYNQSNAYAGGGNGVMGGYESLPNPVPAAQMIYDHVARAISPSFEGSSASLPGTINAGESHISNFSFTLPADWDENNMHIIGLLIDPSGRIDNAASTSISEAVANGFEVGPNLSITEFFDNNIDDELRVYPNPVSDILNVSIISPDAVENTISIYNHAGQLMRTFDVNVTSGAWNFNIDVSKYAKGLYSIEYRNKKATTIKKFVVQ